MISFGQKMAIGGMFADNALQTIDTLTSEQDNQDKFNEIKEVGKETFVEGALLASGMGIGKLSSGANASITASTQSKALGTLAEVGIDGTLSLAADFMITGEFNLEQEGFSQLLNILTGIATAKNIEYKTQLNDIEAKKTYLKNIEVKPDKINTGLKLFDMGFSDIAIKYLSKLDDIQIDKAINLKAKGYPDYYLADAVCLNEVQFKRLNTLEEMNVSKYYITQFASLNGESYKKALELIETTDLNAPSILDIVTSEKTNWDNLIKNYTTGKTKKAQVNDEVMQALDAQAYKLSRFGIENIDEIGDFTREILDDATITQRSKSYESIYKKLISKYENIGKEGWVSDYNFALDSIGDIYGTRLNFENLKASNYPKEVSEILNKKNMTLEQFNSIVKEATISGDLSKLDDDCINLINIIKTNQSQPFVEKLCKGIESGEIKITTLNNYGNEITSYLTNEQILQIAQSFQIAKSKNLVDWNLEIVSRQFDKEMFSNLSTESITGEPIKTFNDENSLENITVLKPNKAVKDSGYAALQMNIKYDIEGQGELQARGSILDGFADREHIPYDIRKGKITPKDTQYKEIYDIIKNMSEEGYIEYNKYLTNVYSALRLQEMGISCNIPEIPNNITNSNGYLFSEASLEKISYENIMLLEH